MIKMSRKGFTLVEVLASTLILAIIAIAIIFALNFSQQMVQSNSNKDAYAAEVQTAADAIMCYVNGGSTTASEIRDVSKVGGEYIYIDASSGYDSTENKIQFKIVPPGAPTGDLYLYKITVRIYYSFTNDRKSLELVCFAHEGW